MGRILKRAKIVFTIQQLDATEERVLNAIDIDGMLSFLCKIISIPSLNGSEGEVRMQEVVARHMRESGLEVDQWELDMESLRQHPAYSAEVDREHGIGIVGALGAGNGPTLIFNGHVDVVPAADAANWRNPIWEGTISKGRVFGRGAADMKGGLCCILYAARALRAAGIPLRGRLLVESVMGEKDGGIGTLASILRGYNANAAIIAEPTGMVIVPTQAGALNFRVTITGKTAHGAMRYEGVSAIEKFIPIQQALFDLEKERNQRFKDPLMSSYPVPFDINIGTLQAGTWASSVPESLTFEGRFGVPVGEDVEEARKSFEEAIYNAVIKDDWLKQHPPKVEWWGGQFGPSFIPSNHPIVEAIKKSFSTINGETPAVQGVPYGGDLRLLVNYAQTPAVLFGPGDARQSHYRDESVPVAELIAVTRTLALTALRFLK